MFMFSADYALDILTKPGGFSVYLARFIQQFYVLPIMGAFFTSLMLTSIAGMFNRLLSKIGENFYFNMLFSLLPICYLLSIYFEITYLLQSTTAILLSLFFAMIYEIIYTKNIIQIKEKESLRLSLQGVLLLLSFYCCAYWGIVTFLIMLVFDLYTKQRKDFILYLYCAVILVLIGIYNNHYLNMKYLNPLSSFHSNVILSLIVVPFIAAHFIPNIKFINNHSVVFNGFLIIVFCVGIFSIDKYLLYDSMTRTNFEMDYYLKNKDWDKIIKTYPDKHSMQSNLYTINILNLALCEKEILCDSMFVYPQAGYKTLLAEWDGSAVHAMSQSDIFFYMGDVAMAQKLAFEGNEASISGGNVRLLKRLVQTNIIYGSYKVAEKYINFLENTLFYRKWASDQRRFLYNDEAVKSDPELCECKKIYDSGDYLSTPNCLRTLQQLIVTNPDNKNILQYLTAYYLLEKNRDALYEIIDKYYDLKKRPSLPYALQEAALMFDPNDEQYIVSHNINIKVEYNLKNFTTFVNKNKNKKDFYKMMDTYYGNTYWYYMLAN